MRQKWTGKNGFSLIELMIAAAIFIVALMPLLMLFINYIVFMESCRNRIIASNDARYILEDIRDTTPFTNDNVITNFPQETDLSGNIGPQKLTDETIFVNYANPTADPLPILVTVNWQERTKPRNLTVTTLMTQR